MAVSLQTSIHHGFSVYPAWMRWLMVPLRVLDWAYGYPRLSCAALILFARMMAFLILEYPRLEYVAQRILYERYAESFDYVDKDELPTMLRDRRFHKERLYQYLPLWRLFIPLIAAASNIVAGMWPRARPFLLYFPHSPKISPSLLVAIGRVTVLETALRVLGEVFWRYIRLDSRPISK